MTFCSTTLTFDVFFTIRGFENDENKTEKMHLNLCNEVEVLAKISFSFSASL